MDEWFYPLEYWYDIIKSLSLYGVHYVAMMKTIVILTLLLLIHGWIIIWDMHYVFSKVGYIGEN